MTRAQCYYEILGVSETATSDEIKKAYRNLALVWHPDKNQSNPEEAHTKFQAILKAYETLSDSRERDWYDRHKDQILSDGKDGEAVDSLNLFQYFSSSCYANYDDSEDGFYTVYRDVFEKISQEEERARQASSRLLKDNKKCARNNNDQPSIPTFGNSKSSYEDVVRHFYAYWSGFCTNFTFDNLDKYNTLEAENRRILRAMEKENKKVKEQAKKERNSNVRNLVEFVKKRDKRLKEHKMLVDKQNELNRQKTAEKRRQQLEKSQQESAAYKPTAWDNMDDIELQLQQLESEYDDDTRKSRNKRSQGKAQDQSDDDSEKDADNRESSGGNSDEEDEEKEIDYLCPACNKSFRSVEAFGNHEGSKKHIQNVAKLTNLLKNEERRLNK